MTNIEDKKLKCRDCGQDFDFSAGEQKFFESKGFNPPSRCTDCRKKKKAGQPTSPQETSAPSGNFTITCSKCAKSTQVPFRPRNTEGILCDECFRASNDKA